MGNVKQNDNTDRYIYTNKKEVLKHTDINDHGYDSASVLIDMIDTVYNLATFEFANDTQTHPDQRQRLREVSQKGQMILDSYLANQNELWFKLCEYTKIFSDITTAVQQTNNQPQLPLTETLENLIQEPYVEIVMKATDEKCSDKLMHWLYKNYQEEVNNLTFFDDRPQHEKYALVYEAREHNLKGEPQLYVLVINRITENITEHRAR